MRKIGFLSGSWPERVRVRQVGWQVIRLVLLLMTLGVATAQNNGGDSQFDVELRQHRGNRQGGQNALDLNEEERRLRMMNAERQKTMVSDAAKLLKLATELNSEVAATNHGALTQAELKRVGEIEKLARKVREKMSFSVRGAPIYPGTLFPDTSPSGGRPN